MPVGRRFVLSVLAASFAFAQSKDALRAAPAMALRWTDETPDAMVDAAKARAMAPKAPERDAVAAMVTITAIHDRAAEGRAQKALDEIAHGADVSAEAKDEALLLARAMAPDEGTPAGVAADRARGVVTDLAILGPFRDTGGGLILREGPEASGGNFGDAQARYSWGTIEVGWRTVPMAYATSAGVPLDLFVHPRKESCSIVATRLTLDRPAAIVVHLATTGNARLMFDGVELGKSEDMNAKAWLDRLAAKVDAAPGSHLVHAKVCTGALTDEGRVRLRITDEKGLAVGATSSDLRNALAPKPAAAKGVAAARPLKVQKLTTPLGRALALAATPDLDAQLGAAVLRTLGGADDQKSPRAQGLLDAVVRHKDLTPDRQAMAGWIAPSGAHRTGWLNLARQRASDGGDPRTRAFVERRQIAEHLLAHMPDWAMAAKRAAAHDDAIDGSSKAPRDAEATLMGALIDQALGTDALRTKALHDLTIAFRAGKQTVPIALVEELSRAASGFDRALTLEAEDELARRGYRGLSRVEATSMRGAAAVSDAAKVAFEGDLEDADDGINVARAASRAGAHDVARALFAKMVTFAPNRADAWGGLADELAATVDPARPGSESALLASLRRARELSPGEARYRAEIKLRAAEGTDPEAREDERYIASSETILARRQGVPAAKGAAMSSDSPKDDPKKTVPDVADRELHWLRAVIMHPDNRVSQLIHYAREIVIAPRTQNELFEDILPRATSPRSSGRACIGKTAAQPSPPRSTTRARARGFAGRSSSPATWSRW